MTFAPAETSVAPASRRLAEPLELPDLPDPPSRRPFPVAASIVPVVGALVMWRVTGSIFMLWFAALGPFMAVASLLDGARAARRARRRGERDLRSACERIRVDVERRHAEERGLRQAAAPDVARAVRHDGWLWRRRGPLVVGSGATDSVVAVAGGEGPDAERVRRDAAVLSSAPVTVAWERGICVRGDDVVGRAVVRALVLQLLLRHPPSAVQLLGAPLAEDWTDGVAHAAPEVAPDAERVAVVRAGEAVPAAATVVVALAHAGDPIPHECAALVDVDDALTGRLVADAGDVELELEAVSLAQARSVATRLRGARKRDAVVLPEGPVPLPHVWERDAAERAGGAAGAGLRAAVGIGEHRADTPPSLVHVDLVADGPHAVVVGTTGAGKSEFLTTWITALAAVHSPSDVVFLLGDFKGGTAFDHLRDLPHVTGVLTDLDGAGARRAVEGLRAEVRRRERIIARAGAREAGDADVDLARLVIVIDEFAALLQDAPDLHAVFTDVAARGRALGMHLVLGTQRAAGILRDALLANSPLRIALRVAEDRESSQLVGTDAAARIPGDARHRGVGYVRRAGDDAAQLARFALTRADDIRTVAQRHDGASRAHGPLLPPLPRRWRPDLAARPDGSIALGLCDDPADQRQREATLAVGHDRGLLVVGGAASGKSSLARWVAQAAREGGRHVVVVPRDTEGAWDALERAEAEPPELFVVDDADALLSRFPPDYAQAAAERLDAIVRDAGETGTTIVLTAARLAGAVGRIADVLPRRVVLALATVHEHTAAGASRDAFDAARPPGRAALDGLETQLALPREETAREASPPPARWHPAAEVTGLVLRAPMHRARSLREAWQETAEVLTLEDVPAGSDLARLAAGRPLALVGDGDAWQRHYALLQQVRSSGEMVVGSDCAAELRTLVGERELPPYARPRAARAWLVAPGSSVRRIVLP